MIKVTVHYGTVECRTWVEPSIMPDGRVRLIGMGSRTDYDVAGNVLDYKIEPTGASLRFGEPEEPLKRSWIDRLLSAINSRT